MTAHRTWTALRQHALELPGVTHDIKWGADWVGSIGGKMFLVGGPEPGPWKACSFKVDAHRFLELTDVPGLRPAPYLARVKWVQLQEPAALPVADLKGLVTRSYELVLASLPRKTQRLLTGA